MTREPLIDLFWPDADLDPGRDSLNNAVSTLRRQLEPAGVERGAVLVADRQSVHLNAATVETDVREFEEAVRRSSLDGTNRLALLRRATEIYVGEFLPGCYDEWAGLEQRRLHESYLDAVERLLDALGPVETMLPQAVSLLRVAAAYEVLVVGLPSATVSAAALDERCECLLDALRERRGPP